MATPYREAAALAGALLSVFGCTDPTVGASEDDEEPAVVGLEVHVDPGAILREVPPYAYGIHTSVYDNSLHAPTLPDRLAEAGIALMRYPGGGYSDNYHWFLHRMTPWADGDAGYLAPRSDFGSFVSVVERTGTAVMITVNYGSNLAGDGPGEPAEAAAWVAYANGQVDDDTALGTDASGYDFGTVGSWAALRSGEPLAEDDGRNFLRIGHPEPLGIRYWEVGNEVFGNGYHDAPGFELDLHVPYDGTEREGHPDLSGTKYGQEVVRYAAAMKAVDPSIAVGAVLNTPPADYAWGPAWNNDVLAACASTIDFAIVHWYPNTDPLLRAPSDTIPEMFTELKRSLRQHAGDRAEAIELVVTELGAPVGASAEVRAVSGVFAADSYLAFIEQGATNIDWLELHNGTFLADDPAVRGPAFLGISLAHRVAGPGDALIRATATRPDVIVAHAGLREDGAVAVLLANAATRSTRQVTIVVDMLDLAPNGELFTYTPRAAGDAGLRILGPEPLAANGGAWTVEVVPESLALLVLWPRD